MRGKAKSKKLSRLVTLWIRGIIRDRLEFKSQQKNFTLQEVNCAHSSRVCPLCLWVSANNRKGDKFKCKVCGYSAHSDHVAAMEILRRDSDCQITLGMNKDAVLKILLQRCRSRLEDQNLPPPHSQLSLEPVLKVFADLKYPHKADLVTVK